MIPKTLVTLLWASVINVSHLLSPWQTPTIVMKFALLVKFTNVVLQIFIIFLENISFFLFSILLKRLFHIGYLLNLFSRISIKGRKEVVFLLCGSDESVHMFCEVGWQGNLQYLYCKYCIWWLYVCVKAVCTKFWYN